MAAKKTKKTKRQVKNAKYRSFKLQKRIVRQTKSFSGSFRIFRTAVGHLWTHKRIYLKLVLVATVLNAVLVKSLASTVDVAGTFEVFNDLFTGVTGDVVGTLGVLSLLSGSTLTPQSEAGFFYQAFLMIILSLAYIWTVRQTYAKQAVKNISEPFYKSTYPLIPFILVLVIIGLQLLPLSLGTFFYGVVIAGGIAANNVEVFIWLILIFLLMLLTLYWLIGSVLALYIVTLPETKPLQALRAAYDLVRNRRWKVFRRLVFLPIALTVIATIILIPLIFLLPVVVEWTFFILASVGLLVTHSYYYHLYRELM